MVGPDLKEGVLDDERVLTEEWPFVRSLADRVAGEDGNLVLEIYNDDGLTLGGFEFLGNHKGIYTVIDGTELIVSGEFDATSRAQTRWAGWAVVRGLMEIENRKW